MTTVRCVLWARATQPTLVSHSLVSRGVFEKGPSEEREDFRGAMKVRALEKLVMVMCKMNTVVGARSASRFDASVWKPSHSRSSGFRPLCALLALLLTMLAFPAIAQHVEVQAGRSYMDDAGSTTVFVEGVLSDHRMGQTLFTWAPDVSLGWIDGRDMPRFRNGRYDPHRSVGLVAAGARFHYGAEGDWYRPLFFSFQGALVSQRTLGLSTPYEFVSTLGWQGRRFSFQIRHISNGNLHTPNRGETMALVGVGFDL